MDSRAEKLTGKVIAGCHLRALAQVWGSGRSDGAIEFASALADTVSFLARVAGLRSLERYSDQGAIVLRGEITDRLELIAGVDSFPQFKAEPSNSIPSTLPPSTPTSGKGRPCRTQLVANLRNQLGHRLCRST